MHSFKKLGNLALDIFFPPICLNCKNYLEDSERPNLICDACFKSIEINKIVFRPQGNFILAAAASYENPALRNLIHYFKYEGFLQAQKPLGEILISYINNLDIDFKNYLIIPVPLYPSKLRKRGFNQSETLGRIISNHFQLSFESNIMERVENTKPQIEMKNHDERKRNLKGAFTVRRENNSKIEKHQIILIDDVYTSGATMNEAVKTLQKAGAGQVIALTVARAG